MLRNVHASKDEKMKTFAGGANCALRWKKNWERVGLFSLKISSSSNTFLMSQLCEILLLLRASIRYSLVEPRQRIEQVGFEIFTRVGVCHLCAFYVSGMGVVCKLECRKQGYLVPEFEDVIKEYLVRMM